MTKRKTQIETSKINTETIISKNSPLVFISHNSNDDEIAEAFSELLSNVSAGILNSFRSSDKKGDQGIEFGELWFPRILKALKESTDIVCLLTNNSLNLPWILFETGIAKGLDFEKILGIAIGIPLDSIYKSPFAQFQNCDTSTDSLVKLVFDLVEKIPNSKPNKEIIRGQVDSFNKKIETILKKSSTSKTKVSVSVDPTAKLFEEIKIMFKDLPSRIENVSIPFNRRKDRRFNPSLFFELEHIARSINPVFGIKILLSPIKNDFPWIYDIAANIIEEIDKTGFTPAINNKINELQEIMNLTFRHPAFREFHDNEFFYREIENLLMSYFHRAGNKKSRK